MEPRSDTSPTPRRWKRAEFEKLIDTGILGEDEHLELVEGEILVVTPPGPEHSASVPALDAELRRVFATGSHIRTQSPVGLDEWSRPEPDLVVVRGKPLEYFRSLPGPNDILLLAEVSWSSLAFDLERKALLYGRALITEYWVLDVDDGCLIVHRYPGTTGYVSVTRHRPPERVRPLHASAAVDVAAFVA